MGEAVLRLGEDAYVLWSDTVDAPISPVLAEADLLSHLRSHHGIDSAEASAAVQRAAAHGSSDPALPLADALATNRAGPDERHLTLDELLERYS